MIQGLWCLRHAYLTRAHSWRSYGQSAWGEEAKLAQGGRLRIAYMVPTWSEKVWDSVNQSVNCSNKPYIYSTPNARGVEIEVSHCEFTIKLVSD